MKYFAIVFLCSLTISCSNLNTNISKEQAQVLEKAKPSKIVNPRYPRRAAIDRLEGYVKFLFDISTDGSVENLRMLDSVPNGIFDDVATHAISQWLFKPAIVEGKPVEQKNMTYTLEFKMGE